MDVKLKLLTAVAFALALAACRPPGAQSQATTPRAPAPPQAQGPVNPDAGVTTYRCMDGSTIVAGYPDRDTAVVTYKDHAYTLKRAGSGPGVRYTGYGLEWRTEGARASITALKPSEETASEPGLACVASQEQPAANPATRASFKPGSDRP